MAPTRTPTDAQPTTPAHARMWPEIALLVGYLLICLISVLTVLLPSTENEEEHGEQQTPSATQSPSSGKPGN